jgi:lysophospholipase L1-like esterase
MIHESVEFHNCAEVSRGDGYVALQRVPESVRGQLNPIAQKAVLQPASAEIRFVVEPGKPAGVTLSSEGWSGVLLFMGDCRSGNLVSLGSEPQTLSVKWGERWVPCLDALRARPHRFDPCVVRLVLMGDQVRFHGAEGDVRPPNPGELPALRYLAYGTSITHGSEALLPHLCYAAQAARHLGADLLNLGMGGSCYAERAIADYVAGRDDWDVTSLALSVNMLGFTEAEFRDRVRYMVHTVAASHPGKPVACITLYPYFCDLGLELESRTMAKTAAFREILREAVRDCPTPNAHLVEGPDILRDIGGLTVDLIHPAEDGMVDMGRNLADVLAVLLNRPS